MISRDYLPAIALGITQIMGYGTLMYAYAVLLPEMVLDLGLSLSEVFGILSLGLFFGGLVSPVAGKLVDRFGGRWVMTLGSVARGVRYGIPGPSRWTHASVHRVGSGCRGCAVDPQGRAGWCGLRLGWP